jgi:hypothetical protein
MRRKMSIPQYREHKRSGQARVIIDRSSGVLIPPEVRKCLKLGVKAVEKQSERLMSYRRVSTDKQGRSGLGLEARDKAIREYATCTGSKVIGENLEDETGNRSDGPELHKAIGQAKRQKATLLVAKLDRLARDARFLLTLIESGVDGVFCDML